MGSIPWRINPNQELNTLATVEETSIWRGPKSGEQPTEVALQYKRLWMVEHWFRSCKSLLQTRPIYHKCDETIRGHVFCSFLALVLRQELQARLKERGHDLEWADVISDLDRLQLVEVEQEGKRFLLRSEAQGTTGKVFQAVGVALPPTVQQASPPTPGGDAAPSPEPSVTPCSLS
jgi:transposase